MFDKYTCFFCYETRKCRKVFSFLIFLVSLQVVTDDLLPLLPVMLFPAHQLLTAAVSALWMVLI